MILTLEVDMVADDGMSAEKIRYMVHVALRVSFADIREVDYCGTVIRQRSSAGGINATQE